MQPYTVSLQLVAGISAIDDRAARAGAESRIRSALERAGLDGFIVAALKAEPRQPRV